MTTSSATIAARLDRLPKSRYIRNLIVQLSLPAPSLPDRRRQRVRLASAIAFWSLRALSR
jgi:hypothetical protein